MQGGDGDDAFYFDDNSGVVQANGGEGNDRFYMGQLFNGDRNYAHIAIPDDRIPTTQTTVGYLSNGCSFPVTAMGGNGDDLFYSLRNAATAILAGGPGNDLFIVRAFALFKQKNSVGNDPKQNKVAVSGSGGSDLVNYAINAPIDASGGPGYDTIIVVGTEFGDRFVLTANGIYGAGLFLAFHGMEEARLLAAEGDDIIHIMGTHPMTSTFVYGGKGSDRIIITPQKPQTVQSWNPRGHTGIIKHTILDGSPEYVEMLSYEVAVNILDVDRDQIQVRDPGNNVLFETTDGLDYHSFQYDYVASRQPKYCDPEVIVNVVTPLPDLGAGWDEFAYPTSAKRLHPPIGQTFDCTDWNTVKTIQINAVDDKGAGGNNELFMAHAVWHKDVLGKTYDYHGVLARSVSFDIVDKHAFNFKTILGEDGKLVVAEGGVTDTFDVYVRPCIPGVETLTFDVSIVGPFRDPQIAVSPSSGVVFDMANNCHIQFTVSAVEDGVRECWHFTDVQLTLIAPIPPCTSAGTCKGNGVCDPAGTCVCNPGYGGHFCQFSRNTCGLRGNPITDDSRPIGYRCQCDVGSTNDISGSCKACDSLNGYVGVYPAQCQPCTATDCVAGTCNVDNNPDFGLCACSTGWTGNLCDVCADNYYPKIGDPASRCSALCIPGVTCTGYHSCDDDGACVCAKGHTGTLCDSCMPGYVMKNIPGGRTQCQPYQCDNGGSLNTALDGPLCDCVGPWTGVNCTECVDATYGANCNVANTTFDNYCYGHGVQDATGACICEPHYGGPNCKLCDIDAGYMGPNSPLGDHNIDAIGGNCSYCIADISCNGNGVCVFPQNSTAPVCSCRPGYVGPSCLCDTVQTCHSHGDCNATQGCACHFGYKGDTCASCETDLQYYGPNPVPGSNETVCTYCDATTTCHDFGVCNTTDGACVCKEGHTAPDCLSCQPNWVWAGIDRGCIFCSDRANCNNHGVCDAIGACICDEGYLGDCGVCDTERWFFGLYGDVDFCGTWRGIDPQRFNVKIADEDTPGVLFVESAGFNEVIEAYNPNTGAVSSVWGTYALDSYTVALTQDPGANPVVMQLNSENVRQAGWNTDPSVIDNSWSQVSFQITGPGADPANGLITFTTADYNIPREIIITGLEDGVDEGIGLMSFPAQPSTVSFIQGPLYVDGGSAPIPSLPIPKMMPEETDARFPPPFDYSKVGDPLFVTEEVDRLIVYDSDNYRNDPMWYTPTYIKGLGMGEDRMLNGIPVSGGIVYAGFEKVDLNLGRGNLTVNTNFLDTATDIITGSGHDTVYIEQTTSNIHVNTGEGDDHILVTKNQRISDIHGLLVIESGPGEDTLHVDASATPSSVLWLDRHAMWGLDWPVEVASATVPFMQVINVNATGGTWTLSFMVGTEKRITNPLDWNIDVIDLQWELHQAYWTPEKVNSCGDRGQSPCALTFVCWKIDTYYYIQFLALSDSIGQYPHQIPTYGTYELPLEYDFSDLTGLAPQELFFDTDMTLRVRMTGINYHQVEHLIIETGQEIDIINVRGTTATNETTIYTHHGDDVIYVGSDADCHLDERLPYLHGWMDYVEHDLIIEAGEENNKLWISDERSHNGKPMTDDTHVEITNTYVKNLAPDGADIYYYAATGTDGSYSAGITISASQGDDDFLVTSTSRRPDPVRTVTTLNGAQGDDVVTIILDINTDDVFAVDTEDGDDVIVAEQSTLPLIISGGHGKDLIRGGQSQDIIFGNQGTVQFRNSSGDVVTQLGFNTEASNHSSNFLDGLWHTVSIAITRLDDVVGDDDLIYANEHNDIVFGGTGKDNIMGATGHDIIMGDHGAVEFDYDVYYKIKNLTTLWEFIGDDDILDGATHDDIILGGTGKDIITGGTGSDLIFGDFGYVDQTLTPYWATFVSCVTAECNTYGGNDTIAGDAGDDFLLGQQESDTITGNTGDDDIWGGHNVLQGTDSSDIIDGGDDNDVILGDNGEIKRWDVGTFPSDPILNQKVWEKYLSPDPQHAYTKRLIRRFDDSDRTYGNDIISGGSGDDILHGQRGDDTIFGGEGDDDIYGEYGMDTLSGGPGSDNILGDVGDILRQFNTEHRGSVR